MPSLRELMNQKKAAAPVPVPATQPEPVRGEVRAAGDTSAPPDVPFEFASEMPSEALKNWILARSIPNTQLGIMIDPEADSEKSPEHAWIIIKNPAAPNLPVFLCRLPLVNLSQSGGPF